MTRVYRLYCIYIYVYTWDILYIWTKHDNSRSRRRRVQYFGMFEWMRSTVREIEAATQPLSNKNILIHCGLCGESYFKLEQFQMCF